MSKFRIVLFLTQLLLFTRTISSQTYSDKNDDTNENDIFTELEDIAEKYQSIDMAVGYSNLPISKLLSKSMSDAVLNETAQFNQYPKSSKGHLRLRQAISTFYAPLIYRTLDVNNEILITSGAISAMDIAIRTHIRSGDEIILVEPFYQPFLEIIQSAGGVPRYVSLYESQLCQTQQTCSSAEWKFNWAEVETVFNKKTKLLFFNNPLNPLGKMFTKYELERIADLCQRWNVIVLSDEVYEFLPLNGRQQHIRFCTLPGMWERTITVGSASKSFQVSGWRIGWAYGPLYLLKTMVPILQISIGDASTPAQEAVAIGFEDEIANWGNRQSYLISLSREVKRKMNYFKRILIRNGWKVIVPEGGFLLVADWSPLEHQIDLSQETGDRLEYRFLKWFARDIGIIAKPITFTDLNRSKYLIRFCFIKTDVTLNMAAERLNYNYYYLIK